MSRRSKVKELEKEIIEDAEVVMRWSRKRIVIATILVVTIILGGLYAIMLLSENKNEVLGTVTQDRPQIKIPKEQDIEEIIDNAKKELSGVNAQNVIESQPKIKKIIDDLTNLTGASSSAKDLICNAVCK